jgi:hypothetical protein
MLSNATLSLKVNIGLLKVSGTDLMIPSNVSSGRAIVMGNMARQQVQQSSPATTNQQKLFIVTSRPPPTPSPSQVIFF